MKKLFLVFFVIITAIISAFPIYANAEEPPCFTIVVHGAPNDLTVSYNHPSMEPFDLGKDKRGWESYFKCEYHEFREFALDAPEEIIRGELRVQSQTKNIDFSIEAPGDLMKTYNNIYTLDLSSRTLTNTNTVGRAALLVAMRLVVTLLAEGAFLWIIGFREKRTWLVFLIVNLITQSMLIIPLTGYIPPNVYWTFVYYGGEVLIFAVEALVYAFAREIADEVEENGDSLEKKPVSSAIDEIYSGKLTLREDA